MDIRFWKLLSIVLGAILGVSLILTLVFGFRIASTNKVKESEIKTNLSNQEKVLKESFQTEREKTLTKYVSEEVFGNFEFSYPKAWETNMRRGDGDPELRLLADPNLIVMKDEEGPATALRVMVKKSLYEDELSLVEGDIQSRNLKVQKNDVTLSGLKGKRFTGKMKDGDPKSQSFVLLSFRDKTLYIGTDDFGKYEKQFESILKSFNISR